MRFVILAAGLLLSTAAFAQTTPATTPAGAPTTTAPAAPAVATPAKPAAAKPAVKPKPAVQTDDQRFEAANTTHDGKLTKDQATKAKWRTVTRAFTAIDKDKKGYVTLEDIKAYNASKKPAKPAAAKPAAAPKP